ncbi:MAG: radical SAM protein [Candidatus Aenigmarchaeota archaeon]|nr:radical SAM protein [Candidatus Aenigmarchaeota archaeon]
MKTVYGPVPSRRLGISLGIDPVCATKGNRICSFDCTYCQLHTMGPVSHTTIRKVFVKTEDVENDLKEALKHTSPDIITISGSSEPTLALNLGEIIKSVKIITELPVAILTNSSLLSKENVRKDLYKLDHVIAKLDASEFDIFKKINRPADGIRLGEIINSLRLFRSEYQGKMSLQMMFIEDNISQAKSLADLAVSIKPDEVQIDTPLRYSPVAPLPKDTLDEIRQIFTKSGLNAISIYDMKKPDTKPVNMKETLLRRPEL